MKKLLTALALVLALAGCANTPTEEPNEPEGPTAIQTLDVATFAGELENTELTSVKIDYVVDAENEVEGRLTAEDTEVRTSIVNELKALTLTKSASQDKIYGSTTLYIDLNGVVDTNYARVAVYEGETTQVVVLTNEGYVNYDLADSTQLDVLKTLIVDYFTPEEAE